VEKSPTQARDRRVLRAMSSKSERARFDSSPPPQFRPGAYGVVNHVEFAPVSRPTRKVHTLLAAHAER
jgi:hypothetical protein